MQPDFHFNGIGRRVERTLKWNELPTLSDYCTVKSNSKTVHTGCLYQRYVNFCGHHSLFLATSVSQDNADISLAGKYYNEISNVTFQSSSVYLFQITAVYHSASVIVYATRSVARTQMYLPRPTYLLTYLLTVLKSNRPDARLRTFSATNCSTLMHNVT